MKKTKANELLLAKVVKLMNADKEENQDSPLAILIKKFLERYLYWCMLRYSIAFF